jgi:glucose-fructose oxidoreductase
MDADATSIEPVRYAVVGLGYIAQNAVLPAFKHAERTKLAALVSDDPEKRKKLGKKYKTPAFGYDEFETALVQENIDAVYIALPNSMHAEYTVRAAQASKHVLCEKPMAVTEEECRRMTEAVRDAQVKLMIAYRLHFEEANLKAIEIAQSGQLGEPRVFDSLFSMQVREHNIRLDLDLGGGTLYDIGVYCINAARGLFRDEPIEVFASIAGGNDSRFEEVEEMASVVMRFPHQRLATFTCSFGAGDLSSYRILGTKGDLLVEPAYDYASRLSHRLTIDGKTRKQTFAKRDQFAAELTYFSGCIREGNDPEPSGAEGLADVRIIEALYRSAKAGQPERIAPIAKPERPSMDQEIHHPPAAEPELVHAESPSY